MVFILLPAYQEEQSLPVLIPKIDAAMRAAGIEYRIIACDDGSRDRTGELLRELARAFPLELITHRINRGLGETVRDLFERAAAICRPEDRIVRMDCDDTHEPEFIPSMLEAFDKDCDVIIASRFRPGGGQEGIDGYRALVSWCANVFMRVFFPIRGVREYSCGFRAYRASLIQKAIETYGNNFIQLKGLGFTCTLEKLVKLDLIGARFTEVPFVLRYDQKKSPSKMVGSITTLGYLVMTLLYYWPWGGWLSGARRRAVNTAPDAR